VAWSTHASYSVMFAGSRRGRKGETACIFIHAGAGFHSHSNELMHLQTCSELVSSQTFLVVVR